MVLLWTLVWSCLTPHVTCCPHSSQAWVLGLLSWELPQEMVLSYYIPLAVLFSAPSLWSNYKFLQLHFCSFQNNYLQVLKNQEVYLHWFPPSRKGYSMWCGAVMSSLHPTDAHGKCKLCRLNCGLSRSTGHGQQPGPTAFASSSMQQVILAATSSTSSVGHRYIPQAANVSPSQRLFKIKTLI